MGMICKHCAGRLTNPPELDAGEWVVVCFHCGARNIIIAVLEVIGWR